MSETKKEDMTRRSYLKYAAGVVAVGVVAAVGYGAYEASQPPPTPPMTQTATATQVVTSVVTATPTTMAPTVKPYPGVGLTWLTGVGHNQAIYVANQQYIQDTLGVTLEQDAEDDEVHLALELKDWLAGGGSYDICSNHPRWNAELMGGGYLVPFNDYFDKFNAWDVYNDTLDTFKKLYCTWNGKVYGMVQDGDIAMMYYRKDILLNPDYQAKFKSKYGYDMEVPPTTWDKMFDIAEFFTGWDWAGDGKPHYGFIAWNIGKDAVETEFLPIWGAASGGKPLFDADVHPLINSPEGVRTLQIINRMKELSPPGILAQGWGETLTAFIQGVVPITLWYPDIGALILSPLSWGGAGGPQWKGKIGYALFPGELGADGKLHRFASMCHGRIMVITKFCKNPEAAARAIIEMDRPARSILNVANTQSGSNPYATSQLDCARYNQYAPVDCEWIQMHVESIKIGYPDIQMPGTEEYYDSLRTHVSGYLAGSESAQNALKSIVTEWEAITDKRGRDKQKAAWTYWLSVLKDAGFNIG